MKSVRTSLIVLFTLLASLVPGMPVAAQSPITEFEAYQTAIDQIAWATVVSTGHVIHTHGDVYVSPLVSADSRIQGSIVVIYDKCTLDPVTSLGPCQGTFRIDPAFDSGSAWEGTWTSVPILGQLPMNRTLATGHGKGLGRLGGMKIVFDFALTDTYPFGIYTGRIIRTSS